MLSTTEAMNALAEGLNAYFEAHNYTWKSSESLTAFEPKKPTIYRFCVPPSDLNEVQMPVNCPAILLALTKWSKVSDRVVQLSISANCVVVDAAEIDKEKAYVKPDGAFEMGTGDEYSQNAANLYRACLLLAECVVDAVSAMSHDADEYMSIDVSEFEPPHALVPDYPYCACAVPMTVNIINNGAHKDNYDNLL